MTVHRPQASSGATSGKYQTGVEVGLCLRHLRGVAHAESLAGAVVEAGAAGHIVQHGPLLVCYLCHAPAAPAVALEAPGEIALDNKLAIRFAAGAPLDRCRGARARLAIVVESKALTDLKTIKGILAAPVPWDWALAPHGH